MPDVPSPLEFVHARPRLCDRRRCRAHSPLQPRLPSTDERPRLRISESHRGLSPRLVRALRAARLASSAATATSHAFRSSGEDREVRSPGSEAAIDVARSESKNRRRPRNSFVRSRARATACFQLGSAGKASGHNRASSWMFRSRSRYAMTLASRSTLSGLQPSTRHDCSISAARRASPGQALHASRRETPLPLHRGETDYRDHRARGASRIVPRSSPSRRAICAAVAGSLQKLANQLVIGGRSTFAQHQRRGIRHPWALPRRGRRG